MSEKVLTLPLKKKWFDMIKSGEKKEEYLTYIKEHNMNNVIIMDFMKK